MNKSHKSFSVAECKIQASILLKSFRSNDISAVKRFQALQELTTISSTEIKRKHALLVIARENGFKSWADLKCQLPFIQGGFLNQWFSNYAEAKSYQQLKGGFILPFKNQVFICDANYIDHLGFDSNDPDWESIERDWISPSNKIAWQRLYTKWQIIQEAHYEKK